MNALNAILLGLSGLLKYQSKMEAHANAAAQCVALKKECDELDTTFRMLTEGVHTEATNTQLTEYMRNLASKVAQINTRHAEVEQMCPVKLEYAIRARNRIQNLRRSELK